MSRHCFCLRVKIAVFINFRFWFYILCILEVLIFWSRCPNAVTMLGGRCFNSCWLLRPGRARKFLFLKSFRKVLDVGLKQHPWRYWNSSIFILSLVMISISQCLTSLEMGMSHRPYVLFLCPIKISVLPLKLFITFLSKIATQSLSHSWNNEISEALCKLSKICAFLHRRLECLLKGYFLFLLHSSSCCLVTGLLVHPWSFLHL